MKKLRVRLTSLHAECLALIELVRGSATSEDVSQLEAERAKKAYQRVHSAYAQLIREDSAREMTRCQDDDSRQQLLALRQDHLGKLAQVEAAWASVLEANERRRLFLASESRLQRRRQGKATEHVLQDARRRMVSELHRMDQIEGQLVDISENIKGAGSLFSSYSFELKNAKVLFNRVVDKAEKDGRYLKWAWYFFMSTCAYIICKRFGLLRLASLIIWGVRLGLAKLITLTMAAISYWVRHDDYELWSIGPGSKVTESLVKEKIIAAVTPQPVTVSVTAGVSMLPEAARFVPPLEALQNIEL